LNQRNERGQRSAAFASENAAEPVGRWDDPTGGVLVLDGPIGTQLAARGVDTSGTAWSAKANEHSPEAVAAIHRDYASAGASVHTANTFRTRSRNIGQRWREFTRRAVTLARSSVPVGHAVAGSIGPLADCYEPEKTPPPSVARHEHRQMIEALAEEGCDLLLCETFANLQEASIATAEAVRTGLPTWVALTAGYRTDLLSAETMAEGAKRLVELGATAVLVNCTPAIVTKVYVDRLAQLQSSARIGAYANAGDRQAGLGWYMHGSGEQATKDVESGKRRAAIRYADCAAEWIQAGATIVGGCCGTGPEHIEQICRRLIDHRT